MIIIANFKFFNNLMIIIVYNAVMVFIQQLFIKVLIYKINNKFTFIATNSI